MWHDLFVNLWTAMFGTLEAGGVNIGFWFALIICIILVVVMNLVFWLIKPKKTQAGFDDADRDNDCKKHK